MKINDWDIAEAQARQWNVTIGHVAVKNDSEWVRGSPIPVMQKNTIGFKPLKIVLLVKANGRQEIIGKRSEILAHLLGPVELELDKFNHKFFAILKKHDANEVAINRFHTLTLEFDCYEYGNEIVQNVSGQTELNVNNPGNIVTPARIEIRPKIGIASVTVSGICRSEIGLDLPVTIRNVEADKVVVLDGDTGLVTQEGQLKAGEVDMWDTPSLLPGTNKISVDTSWVDLTIKFYPRYM